MGEIAVHHFPPKYGDRPQLGSIEMREFSDEAGRRIFAIRKPNLPDSPEVLLTSDALTVASYFNGTRSLRDVQREVKEQYGQLLYIEMLHMLANALHRAGLLEASGVDGEKLMQGDDGIRQTEIGAVPGDSAMSGDALERVVEKAKDTVAGESAENKSV